MTKEQLVYLVARETPYSMYVVGTIVDSLLGNITNALANGEKVQFAGFGVFEPKERAARTGRNPHTREAVPIPARVMPVFKPGQKLKSAVSRGK